MSSIIQLDKVYGVVHNKDYFSFFGFAKKIGSNEIQKIDIYLDDEMIDTIKANEFIEKIDDMYDVENQAFSYNLPFKYIDGVKHQISFKNHNSNEELLNSPYILIDKDHEDFNEARFLHSLNEPISEELKDMYKPNSIGFLATKENLEDEEFMEYIEYISDNFRNNEINCFYYSGAPSSNKILKNIQNIKFIFISSIKDILPNIEIYIHNLNIQNNKLRNSILFDFNNIFCVTFIKNNSNLTLEEHSRILMKPGFIYYDNPTYFGFTEENIKLSNGNMHTMIYSSFFGLNTKLNLRQTMKEYQILNIMSAFTSKKFKEYIRMLHVKLKQYKEEI
ncbi:hypothetical protein [Aliarcobacter butzleri]|uniref:hypothetical protein n=1 Tax=Aliarcobacter butzleri TaxID=28197 RepID=UPI0021B339B8|nr:hypothetical protein [Aliarcobacter butzleri]MCT7580025.1 hypothetical protein [Aliarcobacter butzleri]MCT7584799.1 hypothetical protein [Aliarcobacter butzleri]